MQQIGVRFRVVAAPVDESVHDGEAAEHYVTRLAAAKADAAWAKTRELPAAVLAADTTVLFDGRILGKPVDRTEFERMLRQLAGRTHEVLTGVALRTQDCVRVRRSVSRVTFRAIDVAEIRRYWDTTEPQDKAGGYAVQGYGAVFVAALEGSFSGVMGLPLFETAELLDAAGVVRWSPR